MNSCSLTLPIFQKTEHNLKIYKDHLQDKMSNAIIIIFLKAQSLFKIYCRKSVSFKQVRNRGILDYFQIIVPIFYSLEICFVKSLVKLKLKSFNIATAV